MQPAENQHLVAVVVTHNRLEQVRKTLLRLLGVPAEHLRQIVVVDNASTDGTEAWLSQTRERLVDGRVHVLRLAENRGGAAGFELGMRLAMRRFDPDWIVVMDDDARPEPDAIARFHAGADRACDAVAAAVYQPDGCICEMNRPSHNPFWYWRVFWRTARQGRDGFHLDHAAYRQGATPVDVSSFVGLFLSRRAIERFGYPDGRLFLYGDDALYTLELRRRGGTLLFDPSIRFEHDMRTYTDPAGRFTPLWKLYYHHRNLLLLYRRAAGPLFWLVLLVILPAWMARQKAYGPDAARFRQTLRRAVRDGLLRDLSLSHEAVKALAGPVSGSESRDEIAPSAIPQRTR